MSLSSLIWKIRLFTAQDRKRVSEELSHILIISRYAMGCSTRMSRMPERSSVLVMVGSAFSDKKAVRRSCFAGWLTGNLWKRRALMERVSKVPSAQSASMISNVFSADLEAALLRPITICEITWVGTFKLGNPLVLARDRCLLMVRFE